MSQKKIDICKSCGEKKVLVRAHIIPAAFFRQLRVGQRSPELRSDQPGFYTRRYPKGIYDTGIVCQQCEALFQSPDDYAAKKLIHGNADLEPIILEGEVIGHFLRNYDYKLLKLFFISVLWRAHVSTAPFYSKINLGPYAADALKMIKSQDPGEPSGFSVMLAKFVDYPVAKIILDPHSERWWGVKAYRFYMGGFIVHIKCDKQLFPNSFDPVIMKPGKDLLIPSRDMVNSAEFEVLKKVVLGA